ncbi:MAG: hypothetical protein ACXQT2_02330 [Methanotrichaceae archaeon]
MRFPVDVSDEGIRIDPQDAGARNYKGLALEALHRYAEVDVAFDEARALGTK